MKVTFDTKKKEITLLENVKIIDLLHFLEDLELDVAAWNIVPFKKTEIKKEWYPYYPQTVRYNDYWSSSPSIINCGSTANGSLVRTTTDTYKHNSTANPNPTTVTTAKPDFTLTNAGGKVDSSTQSMQQFVNSVFDGLLNTK